MKKNIASFWFVFIFIHDQIKKLFIWSIECMKTERGKQKSPKTTKKRELKV